MDVSRPVVRVFVCLLNWFGQFDPPVILSRTPRLCHKIPQNSVSSDLHDLLRCAWLCPKRGPARGVQSKGGAILDANQQPDSNFLRARGQVLQRHIVETQFQNRASIFSALCVIARPDPDLPQLKLGKNEDIKCEFASYWLTMASLFVSATIKVFWLWSFSTKKWIRILCMRFMVCSSFIIVNNIGN